MWKLFSKKRRKSKRDYNPTASDVLALLRECPPDARITVAAGKNAGINVTWSAGCASVPLPSSSGHEWGKHLGRITMNAFLFILMLDMALFAAMGAYVFAKTDIMPYLITVKWADLANWKTLWPLIKIGGFATVILICKKVADTLWNELIKA